MQTKADKIKRYIRDYAAYVSAINYRISKLKRDRHILKETITAQYTMREDLKTKLDGFARTLTIIDGCKNIVKDLDDEMKTTLHELTTPESNEDATTEDDNTVSFIIHECETQEN